MQMLPEMQRLKDVCERLQIQTDSHEMWQRLNSCESSLQRFSSMETRLDMLGKQIDRAEHEYSHALRESTHSAGTLTNRVCSLERLGQTMEQHLKALEERVFAALEQQQRRNQGARDNLRETLLQRLTDLDARHQQRLERLRNGLEKAMATWYSV